MNEENMSNSMMMMDAKSEMMGRMMQHHRVMYTFGSLVILGFVIVIILQYLTLKKISK